MVSDLHAIKMFGHNFVRLHQVTPFDLQDCCLQASFLGVV